MIHLAYKAEHYFESKTGIWTVTAGDMELFVYVKEGDKYIIGDVHAGDVFGEVQPVIGRALSDGVVIQEHQARFDDPAARSLWSRLSAVNNDRVSQYRKTIRARIMEYLVEYAAAHGKQIGEMVVVKNRPTWASIATRFGCSREHLNRITLGLKREGFIHYKVAGRSYGIPARNVQAVR